LPAKNGWQFEQASTERFRARVEPVLNVLPHEVHVTVISRYSGWMVVFIFVLVDLAMGLRTSFV